MGRKRGPLTATERGFIDSNAAKSTVEAIAKRLGRTEEAVRKYIERNHIPQGTGPEATRAAIKQELRNSEKWGRLKEEFTDKELKHFEEEYVKLMDQFKGDVLPTEVTQIFQAIKFDILMSRNLIARKCALEDIDRLQRRQTEFIRGLSSGIPESEADREYALALENQLQGAIAAEQHRTTEYTKLHAEHAKLMKDMKATRDQRIKDIESSKTSFLGFMKELQRREVQEREGRQIALFEMAAEKEKRRLGEYHEYADGTVDRPILNDRSVLDE